MEPDLAGKPGTSCYSKSTCEGDSLERPTWFLPGLRESLKFCSFGSEVHISRIEGIWVCDLTEESARTGREQRYSGLLMLRECGIERN